MVTPFRVDPGVEIFRRLSNELLAAIPKDREELPIYIDKHAVIHPADCNCIQAGIERGAVALLADAKNFLRCCELCMGYFAFDRMANHISHLMIIYDVM